MIDKLNNFLEVLSRILAPLFSYFAGKNQVRKEVAENELESLTEAKKIRHRLRTDSKYRNYIRSVFSKK